MGILGLPNVLVKLNQLLKHAVWRNKNLDLLETQVYESLYSKGVRVMCVGLTTEQYNRFKNFPFF